MRKTNVASPPSSPAKEEILRYYEQMLLLRRFELTAQQLYKNGRIPGFIHLYVGEEAVAVGVCAHLNASDWITSTHRGHGHALAKGVPARVVLAELYGKATGCCGGRGGSMHLYDRDQGLFGTSGFVGGGIPAAVGVGLSSRVKKSGALGVAFFGDGAVNHGTFHESINLAAAQSLPVIFICENNLYATATPLTLATRNVDIASRGAAYGLPGIAVDGNDVLAVWKVMKEAAERARRGEGPTLIEARTYRTVGHHEGDPLVGVYRTQEELDAWKARCPIARLRQYVLKEQIANEKQLTQIDQKVEEEVKEAVQFAEKSPLPEPSTVHDHVWANPLHQSLPSASLTSTREQTWLEAVRDGIAEEMRRDSCIMYLGEGIGERGGTFAHTKNLWQEFGGHRVVDTPICELGFTGAALGASATGARTIADLMFADFLFEAATQIIQQAGKLRYMTNGRLGVPMVVRSAMGAIKNAGPHHSGTYYPIWAHCPGLIIAVPSNAADAKGLIKTALRAEDPVLFMEHKSLFSSKSQVPLEEHFVPFGKAAVVREGTDITLVACGLMVHRSLEAAQELETKRISCEVIDLRTLVPLDTDTIIRSVSKTGKVLVIDEAFAMCGLGAEIAAMIQEEAFDELDAPIGRLHTDPVAQPFSPPLEQAIVVTPAKIIEAVNQLLKGVAPKVRRLRAQVQTSRAGEKNNVSSPPSSAKTETIKTTLVSEERSGSSSTRAKEWIEVRLPNQDLTVTEATIVRWLKEIGDTVEAGEPLVEVETEKAVVPVESPAAGILVEVTEKPGSVVPLTALLGWVRP